MSNYLKYRGKCKQFCEEAVKLDPTLRIVRGYYHDALWGKQAHWWCVKPDDTIFDPTILQFPDKNGEYEEFCGFFKCEQCEKEIAEEEGTVYGNYIFCSYECMVACCL